MASTEYFAIDRGPYRYPGQKLHWQRQSSALTMEYEFAFVTILTPGEAQNCLFHSLFLGHSNHFRRTPFNERTKYIKDIRRDLALKLAQRMPGTTKRYYDIINNGQSSAFSGEDFSLVAMQQQLDSNWAIGYGFIEFFTLALNCDIYIIREDKRDIYNSDDLALTITGRRKSIILLFVSDCHYQLLGIQRRNGDVITQFDSQSLVIRTLYARVQALCAAKEPE